MSPKLFCAECGKTGTPLIENLCPDCYVKNHPPLEFKSPPLNRICRECSATQRAHRWVVEKKQRYSFEEVVWRAAFVAVDESIQAKPPWNVPPLQEQITVEITPSVTQETLLEKKNILLVPVEIIITWAYDRSVKPLMISMHTTATIEKTTCDTCAQIRRGYAEAVIQLRFSKQLEKDDLTAKQNEVVRQLSQIIERHPPSSITRLKQQQNGVDISLNRKHIAYTLTQYLQKQYRAEIKKSFKQTRFKHGEHLKKLVISVTIPEN